MNSHQQKFGDTMGHIQEKWRARQCQQPIQRDHSYITYSHCTGHCQHQASECFIDRSRELQVCTVQLIKKGIRKCVRLNNILNKHCSSCRPGHFPPAIVWGVRMVHTRNAQYFFEMSYSKPSLYTGFKGMKRVSCVTNLG